MAHRRRIDALKALTVLALPPPDATLVNDELERVCASGRIRLQSRRRLLEVIHSSRAVDTGLRKYLVYRAGVAKKTIGAVLIYLRDSGVAGATLPASSCRAHQTSVADVRNRYAHEAGAFPPSAAEVDSLLAAMHACFVEVFAL